MFSLLNLFLFLKYVVLCLFTVCVRKQADLQRCILGCRSNVQSCVFLFVWFSVDLSFCLQSVRGRAVIHKSASSVGGVFVCLLVSLFVGVCVFLLADHWCTDPQRCVLGWICGATSDHMFHQHTARSRQGEESSFVLDSPSTTFLSMLLLHVKLYVVAYCHTCFHSTCMWIVNWEGNTLVSPPPGGGKQLCLRLSGTQRTGSGGDQQPTDRPTQKTWWKHCITNTQIQIHCTTNTQTQIHCITHTQSQIHNYGHKYH